MCFKKKKKEKEVIPSKWYKPPKKKMGKKGRNILICSVAAVLIAAVALFFPEIVSALMNSPWEAFDPESEEEILKRAPINEEMYAAIDEYPATKKGETWAIYCYVTGSNLEDCDINEVSEFVSYMISGDADAVSARAYYEQKGHIESFISDVTDKLLPQIEEWQKRPLSEVYPVIFIDAVHYSVRENNVIRKLAAYVILGINCEGRMVHKPGLCSSTRMNASNCALGRVKTFL